MQSNNNPFEHLVPKDENNSNPFEHLIPKEVEPTTFGGKIKRAGSILAEDISKIPSALVESAFKKIAAAPTEIPGYFNQVINEPGKSIKGLARGLGYVQQEAINLGGGPDIAALLAHLKLIKPETAERYFPMQTTNIMERLLGEGDKEPGTALIESLPSVAGWGQVLRIPANLAEKGLVKVSSAISNKLNAEQIAKGLGYKKELSQIKTQLPTHEKNIFEAKTAEEEAQQALVITEKAEKEAKSSARTNILLRSKEPDTIQLEINKADARLHDINNKNIELKKQLSELKPVEKLNPSETSHIHQYESAKERLSKSEKDIEKAKQYYEEAKINSEKSEQILGTHLNKESAHDVQLISPLDKFVNDIEGKSSKEYNKFHEELKETKFQIPKDKMQQLEKINTEKMKDNKYYQALIKLAPTSADVDAATYFAKFRSFRDAFYKLTKSSRAHGIDAIDRLSMDEAIESLKPIRNVIKKTLEKGIGIERGKRLEELNHYFKEKVIPLRNNKLIKNIRSGKGLPKNISDALRVPTLGNELIKSHIKQNPELIKNIVGQRYATKPKSIHNPNEIMQSYINSHPETKALIDQRNKSFKAVKESESNIEKAENIHAAEKEKFKEHKTAYDIKEKEIKYLNKKHKDEIKNYEDKNTKLNSELQKHNDEMTKIHEQQKYRNEVIKDLREKESQKNLALEQHIKAKKQLDMEDSQLSELKKQEKILQSKIARNKKMIEDNKGSINIILTLAKKTFRRIRNLPG